jgi:predicted RNA binding protein YcfA (HicA-like mRNA interferase family)
VKGSHHHLRHAGRPSLRVIVPVHKGDLPLGTLRDIIRQAGLTDDEFVDLP